ncbi:MAG: PAS domain S-box protein, partial [Cyanobacteria bacterium]|nr:PAS domain S-box protein [Cyanobacteriota bacterium]
MRIFQKWIAILSIPLAFEAVFIIVLLLILKRADLEVAKQVRSAIARTTVQEIVIVGDEVAFMVVQYACERDMRIFNRLNQLKETGNGLIEKLKSSCDPADARERKFVDTVQMSLNEVFSLLDRLKTDRDIMAKHFPVAEQAMLALMMKEKIGGVGYGIKELFAHQREVNDEIKKEHAATRLFLKLWVFLGILANIAISATLTIYFSRDTTRRIEALKENSLRLVLSKDLRPSSEGSDEIAELEEVFFEVATAMKDAFDRERANFNHAADAICAIDNSGRIIRLNEAFQNTFGYQDAEILQMHFVRLVSTDARDDFLKLLQDNQHPVERRELVLPMITSGGLTRDFSWSVVWVAGQNVYMCVGHDITEYRKLEQAKQEFAAMLSHDLRGPLTSIGGTFEILSAGAFGKIPEDLAPSVSQGQRSVKKLISLINELLDLEKIEAG